VSFNQPIKIVSGWLGEKVGPYIGRYLCIWTHQTTNFSPRNKKIN